MARRYEDFDESKTGDVWDALFSVENPYRKQDFSEAEMVEMSEVLGLVDSGPSLEELVKVYREGTGGML